VNLTPAYFAARRTECAFGKLFCPFPLLLQDCRRPVYYPYYLVDHFWTTGSKKGVPPPMGIVCNSLYVSATNLVSDATHNLFNVISINYHPIFSICPKILDCNFLFRTFSFFLILMNVCDHVLL